MQYEYFLKFWFHITINFKDPKLVHSRSIQINRLLPYLKGCIKLDLKKKKKI